MPLGLRTKSSDGAIKGAVRIEREKLIDGDLYARIYTSDHEGGYRAKTAVHAMHFGHRIGGARFIAVTGEVDEEDGQELHVAHLAIAMTRKNAAAGLPADGQKSVITCPGRIPPEHVRIRVLSDHIRADDASNELPRDRVDASVGARIGEQFVAPHPFKEATHEAAAVGDEVRQVGDALVVQPVLGGLGQRVISPLEDQPRCGPPIPVLDGANLGVLVADLRQFGREREDLGAGGRDEDVGGDLEQQRGHRFEVRALVARSVDSEAVVAVLAQRVDDGGDVEAPASRRDERAMPVVDGHEGDLRRSQLGEHVHADGSAALHGRMPWAQVEARAGSPERRAEAVRRVTVSVDAEPPAADAEAGDDRNVGALTTVQTPPRAAANVIAEDARTEILALWNRQAAGESRARVRSFLASVLALGLPSSAN